MEKRPRFLIESNIDKNGNESKKLEQKEICIYKFVDFYEQIYLWKNKKSDDCVIEFFDKSKLLAKGIPIVLEWKIGNAKQELKEGKIYIKYYDKEIDIESIKTALEEYNDMDIRESHIAEKLFNRLCEIQNIGPTYAITILDFFSGGYYPIYDRFARRALNAILYHIDFGKKAGSDKDIKWEDYKKYIEDLNEVFNEEYKNWRENIIVNRRIDRALWAYGHLFEKGKI